MKRAPCLRPLDDVRGGGGGGFNVVLDRELPIKEHMVVREKKRYHECGRVPTRLVVVGVRRGENKKENLEV